jgi:hypothetical protein
MVFSMSLLFVCMPAQKLIYPTKNEVEKNSFKVSFRLEVKKFFYQDLNCQCSEHRGWNRQTSSAQPNVKIKKINFIIYF